MMTTLYVTYCCKEKSQRGGRPSQVYLASRIKSFFKRFPKPRGILSHKWGLIPEFFIIKPYEQEHFSDFEGCTNTLKAVCDFYNYDEIVFYSPRPLTEKPWIKLLKASRIKFRVVRSYKEISAQN